MEFLIVLFLLFASLAIQAGVATYWSGIGSEVLFTPDDINVEVEGLSNTDWTVAEANRLAEVSNSQTGNHARRIACLDDTDGSFNVVFDSTLEPRTVGIYKGNTGNLKVYKGESGQYLHQDIIIEKVETKAVVQQGAIMYTVSYKGNGDITESS